MRKKNEKLIENLKEFIKRINELYKFSCVILFGSQARGDFLPYSDIDIIIIGDFKKKFINRADEIYETYKGTHGLDVFCYTPEEFEIMFFKGVVSILDAIDEGICLYGLDFFEKYRNILTKLKKKGLRKDPPVWILPKTMAI